MLLPYRLTQDVSTMQISTCFSTYYEKWYSPQETNEMHRSTKIVLNITGKVTLTWDINMHSPVTREV